LSLLTPFSEVTMSFFRYVIGMVVHNAMAFGNGTVMFPLVRESLVGAGTVSDKQLLFAYTIAQVVPGQANLYVAAVAYLLFGALAAFLSILALNLPGYLMLPLLRCYRRMQDLPAIHNFVRGMTGASVGLIFASTADIAKRSLHEPIGWGVFIAMLASTQILGWRPLVSLGLLTGALAVLLVVV
jgi:chromate transport protein ChrA